MKSKHISYIQYVIENFFHNNEVSSLDEEFEKAKPMMAAKWLLTGPKTMNVLQYGIRGQL